MNSFTLALVFEGRELPVGIREILGTDTESLIPPRWADGIHVTHSEMPLPDALLMVVNGPLSPEMRRIYFTCYRHALPIACLCYGSEPEDESIVSTLAGQELCWTFHSANDVRETLKDGVQDWLRDLSRESLPYPEGRELIESYGSVDRLSVDQDCLERAREVFVRRGFVCLSGSLGAGKTTLARRLMIEAYQDGLNPVEVISRDLDPREIVRLLTGPEECVVFLDIDTLRRLVDIYSEKLWSVVLSLIIRATESRHRLILATSSPFIAGIFDIQNDAHIRLPEPSRERQWRLEEGRGALEWFRGLGSLRKAELLLLAAFDPVVAEAVFKRVLFRFLDRLIVQESSTFPSNDELEKFYSKSLAASGIDPFRRIRGSGEAYLAVSDSVKMWAIDMGIRELLERDAPVIRAFTDTLMESEEPNVRRAGYFLAVFYTSLSDEVKAKLLLHVAREKSAMVLMDVLYMLLGSQKNLDRSLVSMFRIMVNRGSEEVRRAVAATMGRKWILDDADFQEIIKALVDDPDASVRGALLSDMSMWGIAGSGRWIYRKFLSDDGLEVRQALMFHIGVKFPDLDQDEVTVLNRVLEEGESTQIRSLINGLLDRRLEDFNQEFNDLLWVLIGRLPPGGKGRLAWRIGARLRFFSPEVRELLRQDLSEEDLLPVARCMLMNYSSLFESEKSTLWDLVNHRVAVSREFASMVLRYYSIIEEDIRSELLAEVLKSDNYQGREALSQLICLGRRDLIEATISQVDGIMDSDSFQWKASLPFFLLWNYHQLGDSVEGYLNRLENDPSPHVRKNLVNSIRRLGISNSTCDSILVRLAGDPERSVRAAVARTLGEIYQGDGSKVSGTLDELVSDSDTFVRLSALTGLMENIAIPGDKLIPVIKNALEDPVSDIRIRAIEGLRSRKDLFPSEALDEKLADRFADPDRNVRMEVIRLVTETPGLLGSEVIRKKMPDILLDRLSTGHAISEELNMARKIQMDLLPDRPPAPDRCDIEIHYRPAREVGGDYFDFFQLPDRNLGMAVADVAGKGIPAALTMAGLKGNLEAYVKSVYSISDIVRKVNESSVLGEGDPILTGLFYGVLKTDRGDLTYVNAGHNPPLLVKRDGSHSWLEKGGLILGLSSKAQYQHDSIQLQTGDVLVLYTDGLTEAMDADETEFGTSRLTDIVRDNRDLSAHQIASGILDAVNDHSGNAPQSDDQTLVVLKYR